MNLVFKHFRSLRLLICVIGLCPLGISVPEPSLLLWDIVMMNSLCSFGSCQETLVSLMSNFFFPMLAILFAYQLHTVNASFATLLQHFSGTSGSFCHSA